MPADYNIPMTDAQITEALQLMVERVSEGWAQGTYDGSPVGSGSPYYQKHSKWWAMQAADAAARAEAAVPAGTEGAVFFSRAQSLTDSQKAQARQNIQAGGSNRNLLDNPWFTVNQRGQANYTGNTFTVDRWAISSNASNSLAVGSGSITLNVVAGNTFKQNLEAGSIEAGKTYTLSVMDSTGNIYTSSITATTGEVTAVLGTIDGVPMRWEIDGRYSTTRWSILIYSTIVWNITIKAVKLELGSVSTLANDAPPCYAEELAKCQRYFVRLKSPQTYSLFGSGAAGSSTIAYIGVPIPATLRTMPTIAVNEAGSFHLWGDGGERTVTAIAYRGRTDGMLSLQVTASGLTTHHLYHLINASVTCYIDVSADL